MRIATVVAAALLGTASLAGTEHAQAAIQHYELNIPRQPLDSALRDLAQQTGLQIGRFSGTNDGSVMVGPVRGNQTAEQALKTLLNSTGLDYKIVGDTTIAVFNGKDRNGADSNSTLQDGGVQSGNDGRDADSKEASQSKSFWDRFRLAQVGQGAPASVSVADSKGPRADSAERVDLQEIVVSAQKKNENLLDVPVPVTAINAAILAEQNQLQLQDYFSNVPGLNFSSGDRGEMFPNIRGINTGNYTSPTVAIVVDDVAYGSSIAADGSGSAPNINPTDLARIEVLRGPQGTLYGANSLGGLIKFVTVDPSTAGFTGNASVGTSAVHGGSQPGYNFSGQVNLPITDDLAVSASAYAQQIPGYISNPVTGATGINETQMDGGHFATLWSPSDKFSFKLSALVQHVEADGSGFSAPQGLGALQQEFLLGTGSSMNNAEVFSATIRAKLGSIDLTSVTGYNRVRVSNINDVSNFIASLVESSFGVRGVANHETATTNKYTQEIRFSSSIGSHFDWLFGVFWTKENTGDNYATEAVDPTSGTDVGRYGNFDLTNPYQEYAAFADLTFHFSDRFNIQIGGRQSHDELYSQRESVTGPEAALYGPNPVFVAQSLAASEHPFTWQVTPQFKFSPDVMMYARVATGFRPGAGNQPVAVAQGAPGASDPDKTINYELGAKGEVLDHLLSFDASVYYIDWSKIQIQLTTVTGTGYATNGAAAKSEGVDLTAQLRPAEGLSIAGWVSLNDAKLTQAFPAGGYAYGQPGDVLPYTSRVSGNLSVDQSFPLWGEVTGRVGGLVTYVGHRKGNFGGTAIRQDFGGYAKLDLHTVVNYKSWYVNLFANNLADRRGIIGGGLDAYHTGDPLIYITPRTVGVTLERKW